MARDASRRTLLRYAAGAAGTLGLASVAGAMDVDGGHGGTDPQDELPYTVVAGEKMSWSPEILVVPTGATVTFVGNQYPHTVTSADSLQAAADCEYNGGDPEVYDPGDSFTVESPDDTFNLHVGSSESVQITFEAVGEFPYFCVPHCDQLMMATILVREA